MINNQLPTPPPAPAPSSRTGTLAVWVVVIAGLYFAQTVLIPLALAILLTFLLGPIAARLERLRLGRVPSVILVMIMTTLVLAGLGYVVGTQLVDLATKLPGYRGTIVKKAQALRSQEGGVLSRAASAFEELKRDVTAPTTSTVARTTETIQKTTSTLTPQGISTVSQNIERKTAANVPAPAVQVSGGNTAGAPGAVDQPINVKVVEGPSSPIETMLAFLGPIFSWLGQAGLVVVFVLFMLLQREDLRDRVIRLAGQSRIQVTTEALDEAGQRVSRYLLMQLIVNVSYGIPVALGLYFIGLPNAMLWGVLATFLRFIPYIGPWLAAAIPILLSVAVFDDWSRTFMVIGLYVVLELLSNNLMEPMLYGHSTGVSPLAIIVSAVFWTWLWGGVGLLLATPMTVCLAVLGRYVPNMGFLRILLSDEPVLPPGARVYNRLLADDLEEALQIAKEYLSENSLEAVFDNVLMCALGMVERDRHNGALSVEKQKLIWSGMAEMIDVLSETPPEKKSRKFLLGKEDEADKEEEPPPEASEVAARLPSHRVLCLPARDHSDELAATMLSKVLTEGTNHEVRVVSVETLAAEMVGQIQEFKPDLVFISAMPPLATSHARYLCKRIKGESEEIRLLVGLWNADGPMEQASDRLKSVGAESIVKTFKEAVQRL